MVANPKNTDMNINDMPYANKKVYELIQSETDGNVRAFAKSINVSQQSMNRIFCVDKRNGKYPSISNEIKQGIIDTYGKDEIWFISDLSVIASCDEMLTMINPEFAEKQRQENEINTLKGQMAEMSKNMSDLMELNKRLMEQLGVVETSKTKK